MPLVVCALIGVLIERGCFGEDAGDSASVVVCDSEREGEGDGFIVAEIVRLYEGRRLGVLVEDDLMCLLSTVEGDGGAANMMEERARRKGEGFVRPLPQAGGHDALPSEVVKGAVNGLFLLLY